MGITGTGSVPVQDLCRDDLMDSVPASGRDASRLVLTGAALSITALDACQPLHPKPL